MNINETYWYPRKGGCPNEAGWAEPGDEGQYRPDLCRSHTDIKAHCLLSDMHEAKLIYVSNGCEGDYIVSKVVRDCRDADRYDQGYIVERIAHWSNGDGEYWRKKNKEWLSPGEPEAQK